MDFPIFEGTLPASESSVVAISVSLALVSVASFLPFRKLFSLAVRNAKKMTSKRLLVYGRAKGGDGKTACLTTLPQFEEDGRLDVRFPYLLGRGVASLNG